MDAFQIMLRKTGEAPQEIRVEPGTTISDLKEHHNLKGHQFFYKTHRKGSDTIQDLEITAGETLNAFKTSLSGKRQAELRVKQGKTKKMKYSDHVDLHAASSSAVIGAVMVEGERCAKMVDAVKQDTMTIQQQTTAIGRNVVHMTNILQGEDVTPEEGQSVREELATSRVQTRIMQNKVKRLNEKDKQRQRDATQESLENMEQAADIARSTVALSQYKDKATLSKAYKAHLAIISAAEKADKKAERQAKAKGKGKAKAKAKGKAKAVPQEDSEPEQGGAQEAQQQRSEGETHEPLIRETHPGEMTAAVEDPCVEDIECDSLPIQEGKESKEMDKPINVQEDEENPNNESDDEAHIDSLIDDM